MIVRTLLRAVVFGIATTALPLSAFAQSYWIMPRDSQYAQAIQRIGVTDVTVTYHRPLAKGRTIWGCESTDVVPKAGASYPCLVPNGQVWRAGANDATTISFGTAVSIDGHNVPAGTYSLFMIPGAREWTIVLNKTARQWGSFAYDDKQDLLRVQAVPAAGPPQDALVYEFPNVTADSARLELRWDTVRVGFDIHVDTAAQTKARTAANFSGSAGWWAAGYWLNEQHNPEEALKWINASMAFGEDTNNLMMKADILAELKRYDEAIDHAGRALVLVGKMANKDMSAQMTSGIQKKIADWKTAKGRLASVVMLPQM
jgi:hypothetical protein